jgi:hypothetical protein
METAALPLGISLTLDQVDATVVVIGREFESLQPLDRKTPGFPGVFFFPRTSRAEPAATENPQHTRGFALPSEGLSLPM